MRSLLTITAKDLRQRFRDRSAYLFGLVVPLGLIALFSLIIPSFGEEELALEVGVVDRDGGELASAFRATLEQVDVVAEIRDLDEPAAARAAVNEGELDAAYLLPEGFSAAVTGGQRPDLQVIVDPDQALPRLVATSIAEGFAQRIDTAAVAAATVATATGDEALAARAAQLAATRPPAVTLEQGEAEDDRLDATTYLAAGMAVFFLFFTVQFGVFSLLEEREAGTLSRLHAAPIPRAAVYGGKILTSVVIGLASMTVLVLATTLLLDATWGDPAGVVVLVVCGVLAASATVAVVGVAARTAEQASTWQAIIAIVLGMLGGTFFPLTGVPDWLAQLQNVSPHHWFLDGLGELAGGGSLVDALPAAGAMLLFGGLMIVIAGTMVRVRGTGL